MGDRRASVAAPRPASAEGETGGVRPPATLATDQGGAPLSLWPLRAAWARHEGRSSSRGPAPCAATPGTRARRLPTLRWSKRRWPPTTRQRRSSTVSLSIRGRLLGVRTSVPSTSRLPGSLRRRTEARASGRDLSRRRALYTRRTPPPDGDGGSSSAGPHHEEGPTRRYRLIVRPRSRTSTASRCRRTCARCCVAGAGDPASPHTGLVELRPDDVVDAHVGVVLVDFDDRAVRLADAAGDCRRVDRVTSSVA